MKLNRHGDNDKREVWSSAVPSTVPV